MKAKRDTAASLSPVAQALLVIAQQLELKASERLASAPDAHREHAEGFAEGLEHAAEQIRGFARS